MRQGATATLAFYRTRLKKFREQYNAPDLNTLTPLETDEHLALAGTGRGSRFGVIERFPIDRTLLGFIVRSADGRLMPFPPPVP